MVKHTGTFHRKEGHAGLRRELKQCKRDIKISPFPDTSCTSTSVYPLWEVPLGQGQICYVNSPLTSGEIRNFKKEMKSLIEDSIRVAEQLDQFLGLSKLWSHQDPLVNIKVGPEGEEVVDLVDTGTVHSSLAHKV